MEQGRVDVCVMDYQIMCNACIASHGYRVFLGGAPSYSVEFTSLA